VKKSKQKNWQNSQERILDIALKYGFSDHANFTRAFKEVTILLLMNTERVFLC